MQIEKVIGHWIAEGRKQVGMTQAQLGERVGELLGRKAWSRQTVSTAEDGGRSFTAAELVAIAVVLGCNVEDLLEPPLSVQNVLIGDGPPLESRRLRATSSTNADLADLVQAMQELRDEFVVLRGSTQRTDIKFWRAYRKLGSALRGRGIYAPEDTK